jgi:hypothetical protein
MLMLIAALVAAGLWFHADAQVAPIAPSAGPAPAKATPQVGPATHEHPGPPFAVVGSKQRGVPDELGVADALGVRPVKITSPASVAAIAPEGQAFKWVLTVENQLWGLPMLDRHLVFTEKDRDIIKHVIVTRGAPVNSAGKGVVRGGVLWIDSRSGHYHPTPESVRALAVPAFKAAGFATVEPSENLLSD